MTSLLTSVRFLGQKRAYGSGSNLLVSDGTSIKDFLTVVDEHQQDSATKTVA